MRSALVTAVVLGASMLQAPGAQIAQTMVAPNGVHCTSRVPDSANLSCVEQIPGRPGLRCSGAFGPNVPNPPLQAPPFNYSFSEIGKPGVPVFNARTMALLHRIQYYVHSKTLRFAFPLYDAPRLVVYDADHGPCGEGMYQVLNSPGAHNEFYRPGEDPNHLGAYPVDTDPTPFPWMRP